MPLGRHAACSGQMNVIHEILGVLADRKNGRVNLKEHGHIYMESRGKEKNDTSARQSPKPPSVLSWSLTFFCMSC